MLKQRVITAIILASILVALILWLPPGLLATVFALVMMMAAYEWSALAGIESRIARAVYSLALGATLLLATQFMDWRSGAPALLGLIALAWLVAAVVIAFYPRGSGLWGANATVAGIGFLVLAPAWIAVVVLRDAPGGEGLVIYAIALISMADIGAYFSGRALGGPKLMPRVSPAKTWSGCVGGMILSAAFALGVGIAIGLSARRLLLWVAIGAMAAAFSVIGDLLESMVKRHCGKKDSGSLLPGHGGLLDRLDSLSAGLPVFALGILHAGRFW
jgi:phosphatidate cytidylyltransferase